MQRGFSLVELSIVLVILGLLVGGVLSGQSLIHAAQLRSVTVEHDKYIAALNTFKDKYFAIAGDMPNASAFWGLAAICAPTTDTTTCNGNGNGIIEFGGSLFENFTMWKHLANAGLIEGNYTNFSLPVPKYSSTASWMFLQTVNLAPNSNGGSFGVDYRNSLSIFTGYTASETIMPPQDAWNIDTKMDDGLPGTGSVISNKGDGVTTFCTSAAGINADAGATYSLTKTSNDCYLTWLHAM